MTSLSEQLPESLINDKQECQVFACLGVANQNSQMEIADVRRARLREWFKNRTLPEREKSYLSQLMSGKASFGERAARRLEKDYGMGEKYLDDAAGAGSQNTETGPSMRGLVPLISWVQAGGWAEIFDNLAPGEGERIATTYRAKKRTYALRVRGDSMEPKFPDGAILIVEPDEEPTPGKFVIVRQNGDSEATFKQLVQDGSTLYLKPLNARYPIMALRPDAVFCGVVKRIEMDV